MAVPYTNQGPQRYRMVFIKYKVTRKNKIIFLIINFLQQKVIQGMNPNLKKVGLRCEFNCSFKVIPLINYTHQSENILQNTNKVISILDHLLLRSNKSFNLLVFYLLFSGFLLICKPFTSNFSFIPKQIIDPSKFGKNVV